MVNNRIKFKRVILKVLLDYVIINLLLLCNSECEINWHLDLLFYNLKLRCYVVIELKTGKFKPEYAGKLNFYLSAVDDTLKTEIDNPSIGIILCKEKNKLVAEYSLKDMTKPIGVSEYKLLEQIPQDLKGTLPSIEEIEENLE